MHSVSVSRMFFAASLVSYDSEQGALNRAKCECEPVFSQCWQVGCYDTGMVVLCISGDPGEEGSCLEIQLGKDGEQDRAYLVTQFSACMCISDVSSAIHTCSKSFTEKSFLLKKLNLTALMLQQIIPWVGSSFGFTMDVQKQIEIAVSLQTSERKGTCYTRTEDVKMYTDM